MNKIKVGDTLYYHLKYGEVTTIVVKSANYMCILAEDGNKYAPSFCYATREEAVKQNNKNIGHSIKYNLEEIEKFKKAIIMLEEKNKELEKLKL
jgi:hypothetical protein